MKIFQKLDQANFLNKTISFLKENDSFNIEEFKKKVFHGTKSSDTFQEYKENIKKKINLN